MINHDNWQKISALLDEALALAPPQHRAWLDELNAREPALGERLARMLQLSAQGEVTGNLGGAQFHQWLGAALDDLHADAHPDLAGHRLGAWELLEKIGEGGMGQVWRACRADGLYQGSSAIKLLRGDLLGPRLGARFARERAVLARLNHPAIARLLDAGVEQDQAYLVLELVRGQSLSAHVREHCPTLAQRVSLLQQVAEAVDYAHHQLVVHRDLKPSNVLVTPDGAPKLLDFGVAGLIRDESDDAHTDLTRHTGRGLTLGYAAPEQITGDVVGTAADVFSLGVLLFELISGGLPFGERGTPRVQFEHAVLHDEPRRIANVAPDPLGPGRPVDAHAALGDLEAVAAKALRKDPDQRYGSVRDLVEDLQHWQKHRPVSVRRENWRHNARLWLRRHLLLTSSVGLLTMSLSAGLGASLWQWQKAQQAARESDTVTDYLRDLLASASPDKHGGQWPTVLQLLEKSRADIDTRFAEAPDTRLRVLQVLTQTYRQLNRFDLAQPLGEELVAGQLQRHGATDKRTLAARMELARTHLLLGQCDKVVSSIEPALPLVRSAYDPMGNEQIHATTLLLTCYAQVGRLTDAEHMLDEEERLVAPRPAEGIDRIYLLNHRYVLRLAQGRLPEALQALEQTQPFWSRPEAKYQREILNLQRNWLAVRIQLGQYNGIEDQARSLLGKIDTLLSPGNGLSILLRHELALYYQDTGQWASAFQQRADNLAYAQANKVTNPASLLMLQAQDLLARAQAGGLAPAKLQAQASELLSSLGKNGNPLGLQRTDLALVVTRAALAQDNAALADEAVAAVASGLRPARQTGGLQQVQGQLARLRGDLSGSRERLDARLHLYDTYTERRNSEAWVAALDLAYTQALQGDAAAANATLADARTRRPSSLAPGHPLDLVEAYLRTLLAHHGHESAPAVRKAKARLQRHAQGQPSAPDTSGRGSLYGMLY